MKALVALVGIYLVFVLVLVRLCTLGADSRVHAIYLVTWVPGYLRNVGISSIGSRHVRPDAEGKGNKEREVVLILSVSEVVRWVYIGW